VSLYWKNPDVRKYVNVVPTSAITGEGIPDLLQVRLLFPMGPRKTSGITYLHRLTVRKPMSEILEAAEICGLFRAHSTVNSIPLSAVDDKANSDNDG
jgi:hypothetical protein